MPICTAQPDSYRDLSTVHEEIVTSIRQALRRDGNELATRPECVDELAVQACAVFDDVTAAVAAGDPLGALSAGGAAAPFGGTERTQRGIDWAQSLRAGTTLFEVMLPIVLRELAPPNHAAATRISVVLHQAVLARVVRGSLVHMTFLADRIRTSRQDERRHIARELHDRVLHGIGLVLQGLDMHRYHAEASPALARAKLDKSVDLLRQVVRTLQQFSSELRRSVGEGGLERALRSYLEAHAEPLVHVTLRTKGDLAALPADISEEVYLIMREATRNALRHASPSRLDITVEATDRSVYAAVTDDGCGFVPGVSQTGGGLSSMRERVLLLHGQFSLSSAPGSGTRVESRVPLGEWGL
ncbi:hypothetical protein J7E96_15185 [Streptomyces sp. ISL-96]|uniref:sensor histidine kinase n=1 Tax=Streptomyces sp. ISL-96 TaxID=2819191 RepID=UPI001BEA9B09|nr:ATP-binding protein [Streptomyces sp. ISL-96]MBT2489834.1 hypothetical protein [Streptomyces sp. ISL-96]